MNKEKNCKKYILPICIVVFIVVITIVGNILHDMKINNEIYELKNRQYMKYLYIEGECEYGYLEVEIKDKEYTNMNQLYVDVAFYNYINYQGNEITVDELLQEYDNFCNNAGRCDNLEAFYDFDYGRGMPDYEHVKERDDYVYSITKYIRDNYGVSIEDAKIEQVEEAILVEAFVREKYNLLLFEANAQQVEEALLNVKE